MKHAEQIQSASLNLNEQLKLQIHDGNEWRHQIVIFVIIVIDAAPCPMLPLPLFFFPQIQLFSPNSTETGILLTI